MKALVTAIAGQNYLNRALDKYNATNQIVNNGAPSPPSAPRNVVVQSASRGLYVTWNLPQSNSDITGWRVYQNTESNLVATLSDPGTRQLFIPASSGSTPPTVTIFVSSLNALGVESAKASSIGTATVEAGAPGVPGAPPGFNQGGAGGGNKNYRGDQPF